MALSVFDSSDHMKIVKHLLIVAFTLVLFSCGSEAPVNEVEKENEGGESQQQEPNLPKPLAETVIDPTVHFQTHEGFGTSLAWFGNVIGGWPDENRNEIADLLFDVDSGLGFNVVRYNIGGGENPSHNHMRAGGELQGFLPEEGRWDWAADANQRWMLTAAKQRAGDHFIAEAFSNSPPYWMTESQCAAGNDPGSANALANNRYGDFADYLIEVVNHFSKSWDINFRTLEPVNEPEADWWRAYNGQEGAHFDASAQGRIINEVAQSASEKMLDIDVSGMDAAGIDAAIKNYQSYSELTRSNLVQINAHGYHGTGEEQNDLRNLARADNKRLWMSESDGGGQDDPFAESVHSPESMGPGLDLSKRIYGVLRELQPSAWVFWQAVENWPSQIETNKNWGLILADFTSSGSQSSDFRTTKKYSVMAQYSNHIRPGAKMVYVDDSSAVAFLNKDESNLVVVKTNHTDRDLNFVVDLSRFDALAASVQVFSTSRENDHRKLTDVALEGKVFSIMLPANSVTTFVIGSIAYSQGNPIRGNFAIVNRNSEKCLTALGAAVVQSDCFEQERETWNITYVGSGEYKIKHQKSGMYADIQGGSMEAGAKNVLQDKSERNSQRWHILDQGNGFFHIVNAESGFLLDISGGDQASGAASLQWYKNGGSNQDWKLDL